jgi:hypothetical protein
MLVAYGNMYACGQVFERITSFKVRNVIFCWMIIMSLAPRLDLYYPILVST